MILTTHRAMRAFNAGAVGYLEKDTLRMELVETIRSVHAGLRRVPPAIAMAMAMVGEMLVSGEPNSKRSYPFKSYFFVVNLFKPQQRSSWEVS